MREGSSGRRWSASVLLMIVLVVAFALDRIGATYFGFAAAQHLALDGRDVARGHLWQLLTYQLLHGSVWHLAGNLIGIWFFGRFVEDRLGMARMLRIYLAAGLAGGLLQLVLGWVVPRYFGLVPVLGASAGVLGLLAAFAAMEPEGEILVMFVLPIRAKYLLMFSIGVALFFTLVPSDPTIAHAAHLGGLLAGLAYIRWGLRAEDSLRAWPRLRAAPPRRELVEAPAVRGRNRQKRSRGTPEDLTPADFISREVDPILDKISAHGIQSLTERERKILEVARSRMSRR